MKAATVGLAALIDSGVFMDVDLYEIALTQGGPTLHYAAADFDVNVGGTTFSAAGPMLESENAPPTAHWKVGLDVDTWTLTVMPRLVDPITKAAFPDTISSVPWLQAAADGALDGAIVTVTRAYFSTPPVWPVLPGGAVPVGTLPIFYGIVADVNVSSYACEITIEDMRSLLSVNMPRNVYSGSCRHVLFSSRCALVRATYSVALAVAANPTDRNTVIASTLPPAALGSGTYALGRLKFTSGPNAGVTRTIASAAGPSFRLLSPLLATPTAGDAFTVTSGCDKQLSTCQAFGNQVNFGGTPFIPAPEVTV